MAYYQIDMSFKGKGLLWQPPKKLYCYVTHRQFVIRFRLYLMYGHYFQGRINVKKLEKKVCFVMSITSQKRIITYIFYRND